MRSTAAPVADTLKSAADHQPSVTAACPASQSPLSQSGQPLRLLQGKQMQRHLAVYAESHVKFMPSSVG